MNKLASILHDLVCKIVILAKTLVEAVIEGRRLQVEHMAKHRRW
jgi:hypothetical protein